MKTKKSNSILYKSIQKEKKQESFKDHNFHLKQAVIHYKS